MLQWICEKFPRRPKRQSIRCTSLHCRRSSFVRWPFIPQMRFCRVRISTKTINTLFTHYHVCNNIQHSELSLIFVPWIAIWFVSHSCNISSMCGFSDAHLDLPLVWQKMLTFGSHWCFQSIQFAKMNSDSWLGELSSPSKWTRKWMNLCIPNACATSQYFEWFLKKSFIKCGFGWCFWWKYQRSCC